jgi:hypothetical protein
LYLATRHFAGWYMVNVLDLPSEDVAIALGHTDGGELVRRLYGHRDHDRALDRVTIAYGRTASLTQMRLGMDARMPSQEGDIASMTQAGGRPHNVIYDPDAVVDLLAMKSKEEHRALLNAVRKLGELGEQLGPPHMKPLKGDRAAALRELRPRQGRSDWRAVYRRAGGFYVILAIDRHKEFAALIERAQARAERYGGSLKSDKP